MSFDEDGGDGWGGCRSAADRYSGDRADRSRDARSPAPGSHSSPRPDAVLALALRPRARRPVRRKPTGSPDPGRSDTAAATAEPDSDRHELNSEMAARPEELLRHFRTAFAADPAAAYRSWFRAQEELRQEARDPEARALADDLWALQQDLPFATATDRARFVHNLAVFFGSPGPAANLVRARELFSSALQHFSEHDDAGWRARALHNFATALASLATNAADLEESIDRFDSALEWRTSERAIARGVTLHNRGIAYRRLAEFVPSGAKASLTESAASFQEAAQIREKHGLSEGRALSLFHLAMTLERLGADGKRPEALRAAIQCYDDSAQAFAAAGKTDSARLAGERKEAVLKLT